MLLGVYNTESGKKSGNSVATQPQIDLAIWFPIAIGIEDGFVLSGMKNFFYSLSTFFISFLHQCINASIHQWKLVDFRRNQAEGDLKMVCL